MEDAHTPQAFCLSEDQDQSHGRGKKRRADQAKLAPTKRPKEASSEAEWSCASCTFSNPASSTRCQMCGGRARIEANSSGKENNKKQEDRVKPLWCRTACMGDVQLT